MIWDRIQGNWRDFKGRIRERWGKLADDELDVVADRREQLADLLQNRYGFAREAAVREIESFCKACQ